MQASAPLFNADRLGRPAQVACVLLLATLGTLLLGGCSSLLAEHARFVKGWRPGRIVQIDAGSAIQVRFAKDCREAVPADVASNLRYALVRYSQAPSRYGYRVAPLTQTPVFMVGDRVEINVNHCEVPMVKVAGDRE